MLDPRGDKSGPDRASEGPDQQQIGRQRDEFGRLGSIVGMGDAKRIEGFRNSAKYGEQDEEHPDRRRGIDQEEKPADRGKGDASHNIIIRRSSRSDR